jgi:hypothetical protein
MTESLRTCLIALVACAVPGMLHADLIAVFDVNGVPIGPGQSGNLPAGGHWQQVKVPGVDLFFQFWVVPPPPVPPPPPPPQTYRVVQPNGTVIDLGDGKKPKINSAKQEGSQAVFEYDDGSGDKVKIDGTLLKPGDPNPAPVNDERAMLDGPADPLPPAVALADTELFLSQADLTGLPGIDLPFFQYDFSGTTPLDVFQGEEDFSYSDGGAGTITVSTVPEPHGVTLLVTVLLASGLKRGKTARRLERLVAAAQACCRLQIPIGQKRCAGTRMSTISIRRG